MRRPVRTTRARARSATPLAPSPSRRSDLRAITSSSPAARLALDNITKVDVLEYPELGMEAVWKIEVVDFPAFIVVDDKGNDFFAGIQGAGPAKTLLKTK